MPNETSSKSVDCPGSTARTHARWERSCRSREGAEGFCLNQRVRPITELDAATSRHPQLRSATEGNFHGYGWRASLAHPGRHGSARNARVTTFEFQLAEKRTRHMQLREEYGNEINLCFYGDWHRLAWVRKFYERSRNAANCGPISASEDGGGR
jgi:hypothetical protein